MQTYNVSRLPSMIKIGYDGENNWRPQAFNCTPLLANHPSGTISLWLLPDGESQAFPVALERDGNTVVWTPLSEEMTAATGALQLVCTDGTDVGKSAVVLFRVDESILPGAEHPAAVPSWATQTIERAEAAADRAEEAAESIDVEHLEQTIAAAVEEYLEEHPVEAPVQSVNGKTGAVDLDASDIGALPDSTVIPVVPQMATDPNMADWTSGKTVDAAALKTDFQAALLALSDKANASSVYTKTEIDNKGYQTAAQVQSAIAAAAELPSVASADNGKFLRVVNGAWAAQAVPFQTPRVAMTSADTTPTIEPNKLYVFPEMASLAIALAAITDNTIVNEYHFIFESGATATTLSIPAAVNQPDGFTVDANMIYEVSILENNMTAASWEVSA